eukprot:g5254.t1
MAQSSGVANDPSASGESVGYLRYGDVIALYTLATPSGYGRGFCQGDGIIDDALRIHVSDSNHQTGYPFDMRKCLFRVVPMCQYAAQEEYKNKINQLDEEGRDKTEKHIQEYMGVLNESSEKEIEMNKLSMERRINEGETVRYGSAIQLVHIATKKYIRFDSNKLAYHEKDALHAELSEHESQHNWMTIAPRYSIRSVGDDVQIRDEIVLSCTTKPDHFLHMAESKSPHLEPYFPHDGKLHECNFSHESMGWVVHRFRLSAFSRDGPFANASKTKMVEAATLVNLFHAETQSYMNCSLNGMKITSKKDAADSVIPVELLLKENIDGEVWKPPVSAIWMIETMSGGWGGDVEWGKRYCIRHALSGFYLSNVDSSLVLQQSKSSSGVMFQTTSIDNLKAVPCHTGVYIAGAESKKYVTFPVSSNRKITWKDEFSSEDTIRVEPIAENDETDVGILNSIVPFLQRCLEYLNSETFRPKMLQLMLSCLKRALAFVHRLDMDAAALAPDTYDPAYEVGVPSIRSRQILCREQQLCKILVRIVRRSFNILSKDHNKAHKAIIEAAALSAKLTFRLLECILDEYRENEMYLSAEMDIFLNHIGLKTGAERFITTMMTNNEALLESPHGKKAIETFLQTINSQGIQEKALKFLAEACGTKHNAVEKNQNYIFQHMKRELEAVATSTEFSGSFILAIAGDASTKGESCLGSSTGMSSYFNEGDGKVLGDDVRKGLHEVELTWSDKTARQLGISTAKDIDSEGQGFVSLQLFSHALDAPETDDKGINDAKKLSNCFVEQINLYSQLCRDRNYKTIEVLNRLYKYEMCVSIVANVKLHPKLRACFLQLVNHLWLDRAPAFELMVPRLTRVWDNIEKEASAIPSAENANMFVLLQEVIAHHFQCLQGKIDHNEDQKNLLTLEMSKCASFLVRFGYYNTMGTLKDIAGPIIECMDGRNDHAIPEKDKSPSRSASKRRHSAMRKMGTKVLNMTNNVEKIGKNVEQLMVKGTKTAMKGTKKGLKHLKSLAMKRQPTYGLGKKSAGKSKRGSKIFPKPGGISLKLNLFSKSNTTDEHTDEEKRAFRFRRNARNEIVAEIKASIISTLIHILHIATDWQISKVLSDYKQQVQKKPMSTKWFSTEAPRIMHRALKETSAVDLEIMGNVDLATVCFDICLYESVELLNGAVELMVLQNSKLSNLLTKLQELQIITESKDANNWNQCQTDVSLIRDYIERHEIWRDTIEEDHKKDSDHLHALLDHMCQFSASNPMPRVLQKFYVNAGIIPVLLQLPDLEIPQTSAKGKEDTFNIKEKGMKALRMIISRNKRNQEMLFDSINKLIDELSNILYFRTKQDLKWGSVVIVTIAEIFRGNQKLGLKVPTRLFDVVQQYLTKKAQSHKEYLHENDLAIFQSLTVVDDTIIRKNQNRTVKAILGNKKGNLNNPRLLLYSSSVGSSHERRLQALSRYKGNVEGVLTYHVKLLQVLSTSCRGEATLEEVLCKPLIPFQELVDAAKDDRLPRSMRLAILGYIYDVFIDSGIAGESSETLQKALPTLLKVCLSELKAVEWSSEEKPNPSEVSPGFLDLKETTESMFNIIIPMIAVIFDKELWTDMTEARSDLVRMIHVSLGLILSSRTAKHASKDASEVVYNWRRHKSALRTLTLAIQIVRTEEIFDGVDDHKQDAAPKANAVRGSTQTRGKHRKTMLRKQSLISTDNVSRSFSMFLEECKTHDKLGGEKVKELKPLAGKITSILGELDPEVPIELVDLWDTKSKTCNKPIWDRKEGPIVKIMRHVVVRTHRLKIHTLERLVQVICEAIKTKVSAQHSMSLEDRELLTTLCVQLDRLGVTDTLAFLSGLSWGSIFLRHTATETLNILLDASHREKAEMHSLQETLSEYLNSPQGARTCQHLGERLQGSIAWMKSRREAEQARLNSSKRGISHVAVALKVQEEDPNDPGGCLELIENLCSGNYSAGQGILSTQVNDRPVNFIVITVQYLSACSKDIENNFKGIEAGFAALRASMSGPHLTNQYFLATETEFVLIANRILRELNEIARSNKKSIVSDAARNILCCCGKGRGRSSMEIKRLQLEISKVCKTIAESVLSLLEGRKGTVVSKRVLSVLQVSMMKRRLKFIMKNYEASTDPEAMLAEGVEMMNVVLHLGEVDRGLDCSIKDPEDKVYSFFMSNMGHVEICFHGSLQKVYFMLPKMCRQFSTAPLKKMWNQCLPRDEITLLAYQENSRNIYDKMSQEKFLGKIGLKRFFGSNLLFYASIFSYFISLLINILAIANFDHDEITGEVKMHPMDFLGYLSTPVDTRRLTEYLLVGQGTSSSYILLSYCVLEMPVIFKNSKRALRKKNANPIALLYKPVLATLGDPMFMYYVFYVTFAVIAWIDPNDPRVGALIEPGKKHLGMGPLFSTFHLMSILIRNETARNIVNAVIYPFRQLRVAATVGIYLLYIFSMFNFYFYAGDMPNNECDSLLTCFVFTINMGVRSGGGIGDVLAEPSLDDADIKTAGAEGLWYKRAGYDMIFFLVVIIILLNIIFGIIIDTFSDLRSQKEAKEDCKQNMCFICGVDRNRLDQEGSGFNEHVEREHNKWHYLFYLIHCQLTKETEPDDMNTFELYVLHCYESDDIRWIPLGTAMCLKGSEEGSDGELSVESRLKIVQHEVAQLRLTMEKLLQKNSIPP